MEQKSKGKIRWKNSIQTKQIIGFGTIIILIIMITSFLQMRAMDIAIQATYEKMNSKAEYFLESFENEISHIRQLQIEFFNDRKLPFLISSETQLSAYEKREALLSTKEKISTITQVSELVNDGILYLPKSGYRISPGGIRHMTDEDNMCLKEYAGYRKGQIYYDGNEFFIVETGVPKIESNFTPNYLFVITFSPQAIKSSMSALSTAEGSGAFFYREKEDLLLEEGQGIAVGKEISRELRKDDEGDYIRIQQTKVDGNGYLVFVGGIGTVGVFVQYTKEAPIMQSIYQFRIYILLLVAAMIIMAILFILYTWIIIHSPIRVLIKAFDDVKVGNWSKHIQHNSEDEFGYLYEGFNDMEDQISRLIDEVYVQTNLAQRAQLKQLQAQINPHFLYNSFFVLSRRVKRHDFENAQELAKHLGNYFQFLARNESDFVMLRQEVEHAKSYAAIQGTRFISRLSIEFGELPVECEGILVPRLILQPLLENAFEHGLENKMKDGILKVSFEEGENEIRIHVEDNGEEVTDEDICNMQTHLMKTDDGEITGIRNIHKRLQIYLKEKGGLRIERSTLGGVKITVCIGKGGSGDESELIDCR